MYKITYVNSSFLYLIGIHVLVLLKAVFHYIGGSGGIEHDEKGENGSGS